MLITKQIEIDMAHRIPNHESKCRNLHWHRYVIEAWVEWEVIQKSWVANTWMVVDYSDLKKIMINYIDKFFDHWAVFYKDDKYVNILNLLLSFEDQDAAKMHFVNFIPTAENLAKFWFEMIKKPLNDEYDIKLIYLKVWETPTSSATYNPYC